ncbi:class I SAM-dependent methyltransferase [Guyparkeria hydrothermalis]|uniref:class I SAM-dependent methyltransferase n=1 Tax=Guyparkeria TaxID=2035712 RepID=UPI0010ABADF0|nr:MULTISPECIES: class I SAM-dependent methyltransferase [Guyparkeria]MCL7751858.1 class I SAM-dependent methyltransferase [Guyparkeria hydrothermalis]TKA88745.1 class I SAM-dependent methyltransferase [Guyparkeria sp. SB14A]
MREACPLCEARLSPFATVRAGRKEGGRPLAFLECPCCELVVRDPSAWPDRAAEQAHYQLHENRADDPGYRRFLAPSIDRMTARLGPGVAALDFGCGPDSALVAVAREAGAAMVGYDPLFAPDETPLRASAYDLVTCTETVEHLHRPRAVFDRIARLLRPGGCLIVQTGFAPEAARFSNWHYWRDPTHVIFFRARTFEWLAALHGWRVVEVAAPVAVFEIPEKEEIA